MDVYKFICNGKRYIYDSNVNQIAEVDDAIFTAVPDRVEKLMPEKRKEIEEYREKHSLFLPKKKQKMRVDYREIEEELNSNLSHVILNITDRCNFACKYCVFGDSYSYKKNIEKKDMNLETARRAVDFFVDRALKAEELVVGFYGGEPLLRFDSIKEIVNYSKKRIGQAGKGVRFAITTNGSLVTDEVARYFIKNKFSLLVSLDGPRRIHDRYRVDRKGNPTWNGIVTRLKRLRALDPDYYKTHVGFSVVVTPPFELGEIHHFFTSFELMTGGPMFVSLASDQDTTFYERFPATIWDEYRGQIETLKATVVKEVTHGERPDRFVEAFFLKDLYNRWHNRQIGETEDLRINGICIPGRQRTFISSGGDIYPCEKLAYRLPIGNLFRGFDMKRIERLVDEYIRLCDVCFDCWLRRSCQLCFARAIENAGEECCSISKKRKEKACESARKTAERSLEFYTHLMSMDTGIFDRYHSK